MFLGAIADWIWRRVKVGSAELYSVPVASGFIAGEALVAVVLPILIAAGLLAP
jgi:uncharacterized oligopeptide transporter (OPT) family protein